MASPPSLKRTLPLIVQKFGGTSVGSVERIQNAAQRVARWYRMGHPIVVVVSAMSGETNRLLSMAKQINPTPMPRELDQIGSTGEQVTIGLMALALQQLGLRSRSFTGFQAGILTDDAYTKAHIVDIRPHALQKELDQGGIPVVAGFQGMDAKCHITTLGRGGSDTTAVALAAALKAGECQIYTDVDGVYTTDPRVVPEARRLDTISFEEMIEMAGLGSKVLQIRSVEFAGRYKVRLRVLSSLTEDNYGTLITFEEELNMEQPTLSGIAFTRDEAKLTILGVPDHPGIAAHILGAVAEGNIDVDVIVQNVSQDGTTDVSFTVSRNEYLHARSILERVRPKIGARAVQGDDTIAKVSVVGLGMRSHVGIASQMFRCLADKGINIQMISTSEIKISVVIDENRLDDAVRALHRTFDLAQDPGSRLSADAKPTNHSSKSRK